MNLMLKNLKSIFNEVCDVIEDSIDQYSKTAHILKTKSQYESTALLHILSDIVRNCYIFIGNILIYIV